MLLDYLRNNQFDQGLIKGVGALIEPDPKDRSPVPLRTYTFENMSL